MKLKHYQYINTLDGGSTLYNDYLINYFEVSRNQSYDKVIEDLNKKMFIEIKDFNKNKVKVGDKMFIVEKDFYECSYEQFSRLDTILAEENNTANLHKLISIYCRPRIFNWKKLKWDIEPFNLKNQEDISEYLKENMLMEDAHAIMIFFCQNVKLSLQNINIYCLNQKKKDQT